jgi:hypothetical protein
MATRRVAGPVGGIAKVQYSPRVTSALRKMGELMQQKVQKPTKGTGKKGQ